jgi:hypothetical protein
MPHAQAPDIRNAVDDLKQLIARAEAMAHVTADLFDRVIRVDGVEDRQDLERVSHLVGATTEAVQAALEACTELATTLFTTVGA